MRISDWSSDVCSSDLIANPPPRRISSARHPAPAPKGPLPKGTAMLHASNIVHCSSPHDPHRPTTIFGPARSEEHTSELPSLMRISYAVFCLKKKNNSAHKNKDIQTSIIQNTTTNNY